MDNVSQKKRSEIMRAVRSRDTGPEMLLRRSLHQKGYRYRTHVSSLPGTPDTVFPARKKVIFVHGCFWHGHEGCTRSKTPKGNSTFWKKKILENRKRDKKNCVVLKKMGWEVITVWQCQMKNRGDCTADVIAFLGR
jgi:DNA mismatch endonuclease (patch repair protein)